MKKYTDDDNYVCSVFADREFLLLELSHYVPQKKNYFSIFFFVLLIYIICFPSIAIYFKNRS